MASALVHSARVAKPATPSSRPCAKAAFTLIAPVTSTRFWVRAMRLSMSRSMQLLIAQPEATTSDRPIAVASISPQSRVWPWLASRKPPKVAIRLPPVMPGLVTWK